MQNLFLSLLGAFRARLDDQPIPRFYSTKTRALLAYLAVESNQPQPRAKLTGMLWPEYPQSEANLSLRQALFQLNKTLDNRRNQILRVSNQDVQFRGDTTHWLDVSTFERLLAQGALDEATDLYRGPFLDGFTVTDSPTFEEWMQSERSRLHEKVIAALTQLTARAAAKGDHASTQFYAGQMLAHDPWREEGHRSLMLALAQQGQRSAALAQYARCRRILEEEFGVSPETETVDLYKRIRDGGLLQPGRLIEIVNAPSAALAPTALAPRATVVRTPLIGRQSQLTQLLSRLIDPHCRLLTLVGMGGVGKTRLALEAIKELSTAPAGAAQFPDGIWFVPLVEANTVEGAVGIVARTLGLTLYGDRTIVEQLLTHLHHKKLLLILDNVEHLPDAATQIADLLNAALGIKVLVTSQEPLDLWDEWFFPLNGLPTPPHNFADPRAPVNAPAVILFDLNARRRRPDFVLEEQVEQVTRICRLVDGLPLAIELAASWLTRFSCAQIAEQIEADLGFLGTAAVGIPERHRSVRAVLEKSWALLSAEEQDVLSRLAIFRGSFHAQAAQVVAGASIPLLSRLVEKTLLQVTSQDRYQMHDMVRRHAEQMLLHHSQAQADVLARHCDFYLDFIARRREGLFYAVEKVAAAEVDQEFENVLAGWMWAAAQGRFAQMDQAQESLFAFCLNRGRYVEGAGCFGRLVQALESAGVTLESDTAQAQIFGRALARQSFFAVSSGSMEQGMAAMRQALTLARRYQSGADMAFCLTFLGEFEGWQGNFVNARQLLNESIEINESIGELLGGGFALYRLGELTHAAGDFAQARAIFQRCVEISRRINNQDAVGYALDQLGYCGVLVGDLAGAEAAYQESLQSFGEVGNELGLALASTGLGITAWAKGELSTALAWLTDSIARSRKVGHPIHLSTTLSVTGLVFNELADFAQARSFLEEGLALAQQVDYQRGIITCLNGLAEITWQAGDVAQAKTLLNKSLVLAVERGLRPLQAEVMVYQAALCVVENTAAAQTQANELLNKVLAEMPIQSIFRRRAEEMMRRSA
ncbi:tetratricopeptide repeat protein [bacterium]|nr:tetratricopeptide repeat protein [bacterium]